MEKISVIVPIYNAEKKYLTECVDSIIGQDYKNIEVILVDDGSTNSSGEVCDGYADKDERIQVIHQKIKEFQWREILELIRRQGNGLRLWMLTIGWKKYFFRGNGTDKREKRIWLFGICI